MNRKDFILGDIEESGDFYKHEIEAIVEELEKPENESWLEEPYYNGFDEYRVIDKFYQKVLANL